MNKICIFSGTSDGNELITFLKEYDLDITVCVATEYGEELLDSSGISTHIGRMDEKEMYDFYIGKL